MSGRSEIALLVFGALLLLGARRRKGGKGHKHVPPGGAPPGQVPTILSLAQLRELAHAVGMAQPDVGAAIAMAESSGNTRAIGDKGNSIGLWQIHLPTAPKQWADRGMLMHAGFNAMAAKDMSAGGTNWNRWSAFKNKSYLAYMPK